MLNMWLKKETYEELKRTAKSNEKDAHSFRRLMSLTQGESIVLDKDFIVMKREVFNRFIKTKNDAEDKLKDVQAELAWYKVKYQEMKMKNNV